MMLAKTVATIRIIPKVYSRFAEFCLVSSK